MLNPNDTILVSVVGTEGKSRATKHVTARFNSDGTAVNEMGVPQPFKAGIDLTGFNGGGEAPKIPDFPIAQFQALQRAGDKTGVERLQYEYNKALQMVQAGGGVVGGGVQALYGALAKAVIKYLKDNEGFSDSENDEDRFVLKAENVEITPTKVNGAVIYTVSGTAVFGK